MTTHVQGPPDGLAGAAAASAARRARAELKRQVDFSGEALLDAVAACRGPHGAHLGRMPLVELLAAMPGMGRRRAEELAELAGIPPQRRLAGLGHLQVERLAALIDARAARRIARRPATEEA